MKRVLVFAVVAVGCGKPSLEATCRRGASVQCQRAFECNRGAAELLYGTESNCLTQQNRACELFRDYQCDDVSGYERCINDQAAASCSSTVTCSGSNLLSGCSIAGRVTCGATNTMSSGNTCNVTLSQCSDGRTYSLTCQGSSCTCSGDGTTSVTSSCAGRAAAISTCGWNVQP